MSIIDDYSGIAAGVRALREPADVSRNYPPVPLGIFRAGEVEWTGGWPIASVTRIFKYEGFSVVALPAIHIGTPKS